MSNIPAPRIKRVYLPADDGDGRRILVDRLWPRGLRKSEAAIDDWLKDVAPSPALRKWFGHDPAHWVEFQRRYRAEMQANPAVEALGELAAEQAVTLLYAAHDEEHNHARVLAAYLGEHGKAVS
jgi:uncharacterized protein YeaO (DUF488 family)